MKKDEAASACAAPGHDKHHRRFNSGNLSSKLARGKIHMRLRFHVVAKDTVGVPLSGVLEIVFAVRDRKTIR